MSQAILPVSRPCQVLWTRGETNLRPPPPTWASDQALSRQGVGWWLEKARPWLSGPLLPGPTGPQASRYDWERHPSSRIPDKEAGVSGGGEPQAGLRSRSPSTQKGRGGAGGTTEDPLTPSFRGSLTSVTHSLGLSWLFFGPSPPPPILFSQTWRLRAVSSG